MDLLPKKSHSTHVIFHISAYCNILRRKMVIMRTLDNLQALFQKETVLDMSQLSKVLETSTRMTVFRYLQKLGSLTSYTHNGKYYTLPEIAQFDADGFWYFGDIGFSSHGTLVDTLAYVISESESGKLILSLKLIFEHESRMPCELY